MSVRYPSINELPDFSNTPFGAYVKSMNREELEKEEVIPNLEEEEVIPNLEEIPDATKGQAQSTKRIIKIPASSFEKRNFAFIKNKKQRLNEDIELAKNNLRTFITNFTAKTGKKPSDLSKEKRDEIFGKSIALQKYLEEELKKVEAEEEEFKRKYKEKRTRGGRRRHHRTRSRLSTLKRKKGTTKRRLNKKRKGTRKNKNKKY